MDPITILVAGVVTGAASGLGSTATEGIKDAYQALKHLLRRKYGWDSEVNRAIDDVEQSPESGKKRLRSALEGAGIPDEATVAAAQVLLATAKVKVSDVIGDDAQLEDSGQTFIASEGASVDASVSRTVGARASLRNSGQSVQIGRQPPADPGCSRL